MMTHLQASHEDPSVLKRSSSIEEFPSISKMPCTLREDCSNKTEGDNNTDSRHEDATKFYQLSSPNPDFFSDVGVYVSNAWYPMYSREDFSIEPVPINTQMDVSKEPLPINTKAYVSLEPFPVNTKADVSIGWIPANTQAQLSTSVPPTSDSNGTAWTFAPAPKVLSKIITKLNTLLSPSIFTKKHQFLDTGPPDWRYSNIFKVKKASNRKDIS